MYKVLMQQKGLLILDGIIHEASPVVTSTSNEQVTFQNTTFIDTDGTNDFFEINGSGDLFCQNCKFISDGEILYNCDEIYAKVSGTGTGTLKTVFPQCIPFNDQLSLSYNPFTLSELNNMDTVKNWIDNTLIQENAEINQELKYPKFKKFSLNGAPGLLFSQSDGTGDLLESPFHPEITSSNTDEMNPVAEDKTLLIIFKPRNLSDRQTIFEAGETTSGFNIYLDNGMLCAGMYNRKERKFVMHDVPLTAGEIYLVHLEYNAQTKKFRVLLNGNETVSSPIIGFMGLSKDGDSPTGIGGAIGTRFHDFNTASPYTRTYNGILGDILLYNKFFDPAEAQNIYNYLNNKYGSTWTYPTTPQPKIGDWTIFEETELEGFDNDISISQLQPNPFSGKTEFSIYSKNPQRVRIDIYNSIGELVLKLSDGNLSAGTNSFEIDGSLLITGFYVVKIVGNTFVESRKLIKY